MHTDVLFHYIEIFGTIEWFSSKLTMDQLGRVRTNVNSLGNWNIYVKQKILVINSIRVVDKVCPTFGYFSWHEWKLMKLSWCLNTILTIFSFNLWYFLQELQNFMKFYWYYTLLSFSCNVLCWLSVSLLVLLKVDFKISVTLNRFKISKFQTWQWQKLKKCQYCSYLH